MCVGKMCTARCGHENRRESEGRLNKAVGMICRLLTRTRRLVLGGGVKTDISWFLLPHTTGCVATTLAVHGRPITRSVCTSSSWLINCPTVWFFIVESPSHVSEGDSKHTAHLCGDVWTCVVRAKIKNYSRIASYS